jgi:DNA-binding CsgD family transcriptional regulator
MDAELAPKPRALDWSGFALECLALSMKKYKLGIAVVDRQFRFSGVNRYLADMNRLPPEAHPGMKVDEVLGPLVTEVALCLETVFTTGQPLPNVKLTGQLLTRPDPVEFRQFFFPLRGNSKRVIEVGAFVLESKSSSKVQDSYDYVPSPPNEEGPLNNGHPPNLDAMYRPELARTCETGVGLSGRERDVLRLLATGKSSKEISSVLAISVKTVESYRSRVVIKTGASSLPHLVHYAIRHKIVGLLY